MQQEERAREPEARVNERPRTFLFPPGREREEFSFTMEDKAFKNFKNAFIYYPFSSSVDEKSWIFLRRYPTLMSK